MPRLLHELPNAALQIVDARSHLVDFGDDGLRHGLEASLHLQQQVLHERREVRGLLRGGISALVLGGVRLAMAAGIHDAARNGGLPLLVLPPCSNSAKRTMEP